MIGQLGWNSKIFDKKSVRRIDEDERMFWILINVDKWYSIRIGSPWNRDRDTLLTTNQGNLCFEILDRYYFKWSKSRKSENYTTTSPFIHDYTTTLPLDTWLHNHTPPWYMMSSVLNGRINHWGAWSFFPSESRHKLFEKVSITTAEVTLKPLIMSNDSKVFTGVIQAQSST
jgi:hypothetical protein